MSILKKLYKGWMAFAHVLGRFMTVVWMVIFYCLFLPPFSLIRFSDPLKKKLGMDETYWEDRPEVEPTIENFTHPF